jgi:hypothetical protein
MCYATLSIDGILTILDSTTIKTKQNPTISKRKNVQDVSRVSSLIVDVMSYIDSIDVTHIYIETPVGSQSSRAMFSYGVCITIEAYLKSIDYTVVSTSIRDTITRVNGSNKSDTIAYIHNLFPDLLKKNKAGEPLKHQEHVADAACAILNGLDAQGIKYEINPK